MKKSYYVSVNDSGKVSGAGDIRSSEDAEVVLQIPGQQAKNFSGDGLTQWEAIAEAMAYIKAGADDADRAERARQVQIKTGKMPYGPGDLLTRNVVLVDLDDDELAQLKSGERAVDLQSVPDVKSGWAKVRAGKAKLVK